MRNILFRFIYIFSVVSCGIFNLGIYSTFLINVAQKNGI